MGHASGIPLELGYASGASPESDYTAGVPLERSLTTGLEYHWSICQTCATTKHRACPEVVELDEKANKARASLDEMLSMLTVGEADLENAALELSSQLQQIDKTALEGIEEVLTMHA
nr:hypothetical protein BaRGS_018686 [Batillaria attramentaria]